MTEKYTLPTIEEVIQAAQTAEGRLALINSFRTETDNLSIQEAQARKRQLDNEVAVLVDRIQDALREVYDHENGEFESNVWDLKQLAIESYGYDSYTDDGWVSSDY